VFCILLTLVKKMIEKRKIEITMKEFYEAIRLFVHETHGVVMPVERTDVKMSTDEHKLTFEWEYK
jgi:hypothetical protein